jgi:hypothetical protein
VLCPELDQRGPPLPEDRLQDGLHLTVAVFWAEHERCVLRSFSGAVFMGCTGIGGGDSGDFAAHMSNHKRAITSTSPRSQQPPLVRYQHDEQLCRTSSVCWPHLARGPGPWLRKQRALESEPRLKKSDVQDFFGKVGRVADVRLLNGFGFVEFEEPRVSSAS